MAAIDEDIVIVGGGIAGLCTAVALQRLGLKSLVLESSESYRVTGGALSIWKNGWKALDVLGVADFLRSQHCPHSRMVETSATLGVQIAQHPCGENEARCVRRRVLLETLAKELPSDRVRFSSKVDSIENSGYKKMLHLADGSILTTKVVVGCDGVNSGVARWLGFKKPSYTNRMGIRAFVDFGEHHGLEPDFNQIYGNGWRSGFIPCDDTVVCWFFTWCPSEQDIQEEIKDKPMKLKQHVLSALEGQPEKLKDVVKKTKLEDIACARLGHRLPWEILWGNISKENVCVVGDAFHPMVPDLGQGACSALEDGIILARCLAQAFGLLNHGYSVRAFVRSTSDLSLLPDTDVTPHFELSFGDVTDYSSLLYALSGCHLIIHSAALVEPWLPTPSLFFTVNVGGLRNVIQAYKESKGIEKIVYTSSFFALGPTDVGFVADENQVHHEKFYCTEYERSKVEADKIALRAASEGFPIVPVYPGIIYGAGKITAGNVVARLLIERFNWRLPGYIGPGNDKYSFSHVDDVVEGHIAALEKGRTGERYLLTGENASFKYVFDAAAILTNTNKPRFSIPMWAIEAYGWISVLLSRITGKLPLLSPPTVHVLRHQWAYSCEKARKELGYNPRSLKEGLEEVLPWLKGAGLINY